MAAIRSAVPEWVSSKTQTEKIYQFIFCSVHLMVTQLHTSPGFVDRFLEDTRAVVNHMLETPDEPAEGSVRTFLHEIEHHRIQFVSSCLLQAALYGMTQKIPDRRLVKEFACAYLDACYSFPAK